MTKKFEVDKDNLSKPFFAYGIFKPGQLAYSRIEKYVKGEPKECTVKHALYERDGIPFVKKDNTEYETHGYMIQFKVCKEELAYNLISETESEKYYLWGTTKAFDEEGNEIASKGVNILFGRSPTQSNPFLVEDGIYDGNNDIFFKYAIRLITTDMKNYKKRDTFENFFKLQRNYLLLWVCIERYATLKYGQKDIMPNLHLLAEDETFVKYFKHFVTEERVIHRSDNPTKKRKLDPEDSKKSMDYYYQMRSNVAHRGKVLSDVDERKLRKSLVELLNIFQCVLEDTYEHMHFSRVDINIGDKEDSEGYERFKLKSENVIHDDAISGDFNLDSIDGKKMLVSWLNVLNEEI